MKTFIKLLSVCAILVGIGCTKTVEVEPEIVDVTSVTITPTTLQLAEGTSASLTVKVEPSNATDQNIKWFCDSEAAVVDSEGKVFALKEGMATVTASAGGKKASCTVSVVSTYIPVTQVSLDHPTLSIVEGELVTLTVTVLPDNSSNKTVFWSSSNTSIAIVSGDGKVGALKPGKAVITATADGKSASCEVSVERRFVAVSHVWLNQYSLGLTEGDSFTLIAEVEPEDASDPTVTWSSSNEAVATVTGGVVTAIAEGTANITAAAGEKSAICEVKVYPIYGYVDLGLSVLWATCNVGASQPEERGNYYAWGEIEPKEDYSWTSYKWCNGGLYYNLIKYNTTPEYGYEPDNLVVLESEDDIATITRGPKWRTPTSDEFDELCRHCSWHFSSLNGVSGYQVYSTATGNSIFIPAIGHYMGTSLINDGVYAYYWSSSLDSSKPSHALVLLFYDYYWVSLTQYDRYRGMPIRPVMDH